MVHFDQADFRRFVARFNWTFAKTYAKNGPHEYIVLDKVGREYKKEFATVARFIRESGFRARYFSREGFYYVLDDFYYWTMDENPEDTDLINRAKIIDYELIDNAWYWKGRKK